MSSSRPASALLLCLVAALGYANWTLTRHEIDITPLAPPQAATSNQAALPMPQAEPSRPPLSDYRETITRPLFSPSRKPVVPVQADDSSAELVKEPPPPGPAPLEPSGLKVAGVMVAKGRMQRALLRVEGQPHGQWVAVGSEIRGWKLTRIEEDLVVVEREGGLEELLLHSPPR